MLTRIDEDCFLNGALPKRYYNPSVDDSACLTEINNYCKQVLTQNSRDPKNMDALYNHYGIQIE